MKPLRNDIMKSIEEYWPISVTEIARRIGILKRGSDEKERKAAIAKIVYHVKKLKENERIKTKKIGKTMIIWPSDIEKLRLIHELIK